MDLVNFRLDYVKAYKSAWYFNDHVMLARKLVREWPGLTCSMITPQMGQAYLTKSHKVSALTANKDLRYIKAMFNFGVKRGLNEENPTRFLKFFPVGKRLGYIPLREDLAKVLQAADPNTRDYLIAIKESIARVREINRLIWDDVDFERRGVILYTRKKKGGT